MMKALLRTLACCVCLLLSNGALAAITVSFTADLSDIFGPEDYTYTIGLPDFPAASTWVELSEPSCQVCYSTLLAPDAREGGWSEENYAMVLMKIMGEDGGYYMSAYYFEPGALGSFGTHESLSPLRPATLTISAIPEPAAVHLLLAGAAGLAMLHRRARRTALKPTSASTGQL